jgi:hypothetical protein
LIYAPGSAVCWIPSASAVTGAQLKLASEPGDPPKTSIDFSNVKKLKGVTFWPADVSILWIIAALKTIALEHKDFREVSIEIPFQYPMGSVHNPFDPWQTAGEEVYRQWTELDYLLVRFCESHGIGIVVRYVVIEKKKEALEFIEGLLPETMKRGNPKLVDLVNL